MIDRDTLLASMRRDLRKIAPTLQAEGWSQADIAEISALIRGHIATGDDVALQATAKWLSDRAWAVLEQMRERRERQRAGMCAVAPVLSLEVEKMLCDREWSQSNQGKRRPQ